MSAHHDPAPRVRLLRDNGRWHALFTGPAADEVRAVFGSAYLPTGWPALTPGAEVRAALLRQSPHWDIEVPDL